MRGMELLCNIVLCVSLAAAAFFLVCAGIDAIRFGKKKSRRLDELENERSKVAAEKAQLEANAVKIDFDEKLNSVIERLVTLDKRWDDSIKLVQASFDRKLDEEKRNAEDARQSLNETRSALEEERRSHAKTKEELKAGRRDVAAAKEALARQRQDQSTIEALTKDKEKAVAEKKAAEAARIAAEKAKQAAEGKETAARNEATQLKARLDSFGWLLPSVDSWVQVEGTICGLVGGGKTDWYSDSVRGAILHSFSSFSFPLSGNKGDSTLDGSPDEKILRVDEFFYKHLEKDGDEGLENLQALRKCYFGKFNEEFKGRYEVRWPEKGTELDEDYCRADPDNGFTEVRVAKSCAVFEGGELKRRARVETVARK